MDELSFEDSLDNSIQSLKQIDTLDFLDADFDGLILDDTFELPPPSNTKLQDDYRVSHMCITNTQELKFDLMDQDISLNTPKKKLKFRNSVYEFQSDIFKDDHSSYKKTNIKNPLSKSVEETPIDEEEIENDGSIISESSSCELFHRLNRSDLDDFSIGDEDAVCENVPIIDFGESSEENIPLSTPIKKPTKQSNVLLSNDEHKDLVNSFNLTYLSVMDSTKSNRFTDSFVDVRKSRIVRELDVVLENYLEETPKQLKRYNSLSVKSSRFSTYLSKIFKKNNSGESSQDSGENKITKNGLLKKLRFNPTKSLINPILSDSSFVIPELDIFDNQSDNIQIALNRLNGTEQTKEIRNYHVKNVIEKQDRIKVTMDKLNGPTSNQNIDNEGFSDDDSKSLSEIRTQYYVDLLLTKQRDQNIMEPISTNSYIDNGFSSKCPKISKPTHNKGLKSFKSRFNTLLNK